MFGANYFGEIYFGEAFPNLAAVSPVTSFSPGHEFGFLVDIDEQAEYIERIHKDDEDIIVLAAQVIINETLYN